MTDIRITRKRLESRVNDVNKCCKVDYCLEYNRYYGYQLTSNNGMTNVTVRLDNQQMLMFLNGMLHMTDIVAKRERYANA